MTDKKAHKENQKRELLNEVLTTRNTAAAPGRHEGKGFGF